MAEHLSTKNKAAVIEALESGRVPSLRQAAISLKLVPQVVYHARKEDPQFKAATDELLSKVKDRPAPDDEFPDFLTWRERFMGYYLPNGDVVRASSYWFHDEAYKGIMDNNRVMILVPPMHMKTTMWSIEFSTYLIMKNRKTRITVIQKSQDESKKIVRSVQQRLTDHSFYEGLGIPRYEDPITLYGGKHGFKPEKYGGEGQWNANAFTVPDTGWGEKDPTMQAKGAEGAILSNRADYIILDDIQDGGAYSPHTSDKILQWLTQNVLTRLGPESKLVILGSRLGPADIYEKLMNSTEAEDWPVIRFPAAFSPGTHDPWNPSDGPGESLLPDLWPWDKLMAKRKEVGRAWYTSYMQEEGDRDGAVFTRDKLEAARNYEMVLGIVPEPVTHIYIGMDPAIKAWNVITVWGLDKRTGIRYLIDLIRRKELNNWDNAIDLLSEAADRYGPRKVVIEVNNTQGHVADTARRVLGAAGHQIVEYKTATGLGAQQHDQDYSISSIGSLFDGHLVQLPYGDSKTREIVDGFITEFTRWHTSEEGTSVKKLTRDQVMATLFAESEARLEMRRSDQAFLQHGPKRRFAGNGDGGWRWGRRHVSVSR